MARLAGVDVTVFSIGGESVLADLRQAEVVARTRFADVTPVTLGGQAREAVKQSVVIRGTLTSTKQSGSRVTHLDVSAVALAGLDYRPVVESAVVEGRMTLEDGSGVGDEWEVPVTVRKDYRARLEMSVDSSGSVSLVAKAFGMLANKKVELSMVVNDVSVTIPMQLAKFSHGLSAGSRQKWTLDLIGSAVVGAAYPGSPTGAATLLEHSFTSPGAALLVGVCGGAGQPTMSGQFMIEKFGFRVDRGLAVESTYELVSVGSVTQS